MRESVNLEKKKRVWSLANFLFRPNFTYKWKKE